MPLIFEAKDILITQAESPFTKALVSFFCEENLSKLLLIGEKSSLPCSQAMLFPTFEQALQEVARLDIVITILSITPIKNQEISLVSLYVQKLWQMLKISIPKIAQAEGGNLLIVLQNDAKIPTPEQEFETIRHALIGLMRTVAVEAAKLNVKLNLLTIGKHGDDKLPENFLDTIQFLCSDAGKFITGSEHYLSKEAVKISKS